MIGEFFAKSCNRFCGLSRSKVRISGGCQASTARGSAHLVNRLSRPVGSWRCPTSLPSREGRRCLTVGMKALKSKYKSCSEV